MTTQPRPSHLPLADWRRRAPIVPGTSVLMAIDERTPGADMYGGMISIPAGDSVPIHWHEVGEVQFVLSGNGVFVDAEGNETPVTPHDLLYAPGGPAAAHGFRNTSSMPLIILFCYPSPGGIRPPSHPASAAVGSDRALSEDGAGPQRP